MSQLTLDRPGTDVTSSQPTRVTAVVDRALVARPVLHAAGDRARSPGARHVARRAAQALAAAAPAA